MPGDDLHSDKDLLSRIAEGDERAFTKLFEMYSAPLANIALRILHTETGKQEIIQEVFMKIWLNRDRLPEVQNLPAWLKKVTINECLSYLRKAAGYEGKLLAFGQGLPTFNYQENSLSLKEIKAAVQKAIESMPAQRKTIFLLSREKGMSSKEIAGSMGLSDGYVRNALSAALQTIREFLPASVNLPLIFLIFISIG